MSPLTRTARVALNTVTNYLRFGVTVVVFLLLTPVMIRYLGTEGFGLWSLLFAVLGFFGLLDMGAGTSVVKYMAECAASGDADRRNRILSTLAQLYIAAALIATLGTMVMAAILQPVFGIGAAVLPDARQALWILSARTVILGLPLSLFRNILFGAQEIYFLNVVQTISIVAYGLASWAVLVRGGGVVALAWVSLAFMLAEHAVYAVACFTRVKGLRITPRLVDYGQIGSIVSFSAAALLINVASLILLRTDPVIVGLFLPLTAVALYATAQKIAEYSVLFTKQFVNVLAPLAVELKADPDPTKVRFLLVNCARFALAPSAALSVCLFVEGRDALSVWLGPAFGDAAPVLWILLAALLLSIPQMLASTILTMTGRHRLIGFAAAGSALLNVAVSLALVHLVGMLGVAIGTLTATVVVDVFVVLRAACREFGLGLPSYARRVLPAVLVPGAVQFALTFGLRAAFPPRHILGVALLCLPGLAVFFASFWLFFVEPSEKRLLAEKLVRFRK